MPVNNYSMYERGYALFSGSGEAGTLPQEILDDKNVIGLSATSLKYLDMIYDLAKENDAELLIIRAPFPWWGEVTEQMNALKIWAEERDITFLDLMYFHEDINFNYETDTLDGKHLNDIGSVKTSHFVGKWLADNGHAVDSE